MELIQSAKRIGVSFGLLALFLVGPTCVRARMRCVTGRRGGIDKHVGTTTSYFNIQHYKFDVVPCADDTPRRSSDGGPSVLKAGKEAASFVAWIGAKTGWTILGVPPIRFVPYAELVKIFSGGKGTEWHVESLYSETDHTIYLPDSWRADDLRDRSILLHELVHHLQYLNYAKAACPSEYELQAIELQMTWLREQGADDPVDLLGIDPRYLLMLRECE